MTMLLSAASWPRNIIMMLALLAVAGASLIIGTVLIRRAQSLKRQTQRLDAAVAARAGVTVQRNQVDWRARLLDMGLRGLGSSLGKSFVADEDRTLLDQCGVDHPTGRSVFFLARAGLAFLLPVLLWLAFSNGSVLRSLLAVFAGFGIGYMSPKWFMSRRAAQRRRAADREIPLLVDLLRLLQGVGLGIDQAMHLIERDFAASMPVLVVELGHASAQYRSGQTRAASLQRFAQVYRNDDMTTLAELIVQVDRFGGGVQEPLLQFGERMRERRRLDMKTRTGQLTVKMTGVMVLTLLPALIIVTGGAGFLAVFRGLARLQGGV